MGAIIRASSASLDPDIYSSIEHATTAGKKCLHAAELPFENVDLLFNVGIYRDQNMLEPSMAAIIQKGLGINLDYIKSVNKKAAASFDLMNGTCGVLNAAQVASAFLATHSAKFALIVSSDAHPSSKPTEKFPYATLGAAMLLEWSEQESKGFGRFQFRTSQDDFLGLKGYCKFHELHARENVVIEEHPEYAARLLEFMTQSIREYIVAEKISADNTLFITSQLSPDFPCKLARKLKISENSVVQMLNIERDPHSSAMTLAYYHALLDEKYKSYKQILFAAGGAGLTSGCVVYRQ